MHIQAGEELFRCVLTLLWGALGTGTSGAPEDWNRVSIPLDSRQELRCRGGSQALGGGRALSVWDRGRGLPPFISVPSPMSWLQTGLGLGELVPPESQRLAWGIFL